MKNTLQFLCISLIFFVTPVLAQVIQCPGSSNFANIGDSVEQVIQKCGEPIKKKDIKQEAAVWIYNLMSFADNHIGFSIYFEGDSVTKITTTQLIEKTAIACPYGRVTIGSKPSQVVSACGQPSKIQNLSKQLNKKDGQITYLIYQPHPYLPKTTLIFKNGALVDSHSN